MTWSTFDWAVGQIWDKFEYEPFSYGPRLRFACAYLAFNDPEYDDWSLCELADLCRVSHMLVRDMKAEQNENVSDETVSSYSDESVNINSNGSGNCSTNRTVTPRPRKPAPTQDQIDRQELLGLRRARLG